jgi:hypothetical protein
MIWVGSSLGGELTALPSLEGGASPWRAVGWLIIWATGSVYALAVMVPLLPPPRRSFSRVVIVLLAGAFSYWAAVQFAVEAPLVSAGVVSVTIAGALAALFIGVVVRGMGTRTLDAWRWPALALAGALGGVLIGLAVDYLDDSDAWTWAPGHVVWQVATCAVLWWRRAADPRPMIREAV